MIIKTLIIPVFAIFFTFLGKAQSTQKIYAQINELCEQKKYDQALILLNEAIANNPISDSLYYYQGMLYTDYLNKQEDALVSFWKSVEINPQFAFGYFGIGKANLELNRLDTAIEAFNNAINFDKDFFEAWSNLGYAYYLKAANFSGVQSKAMDCFNRAIEINPEFSDTYLKRGMVYYDTYKYTEATEDFDNYAALMQEKPKDNLYYFYSGFTAYYLKDHQTAVDQLDIYMTTDSLDADALFLYGLACNNNGDFAKAIVCFTKITEIDTTHAEAYNLLGLAYYNSEDLTMAFPFYKKAAMLGNKEAAKQIKTVYNKQMQKVNSPALGISFTLHPYWNYNELVDSAHCFGQGMMINDPYMKINMVVLKNDTAANLNSDSCKVLGHSFGTSGNWEEYITTAMQWKRQISTETWNSQGIEYPIAIWTLNHIVTGTKLTLYIWGKTEEMRTYHVYMDEFLESIKLNNK